MKKLFTIGLFTLACSLMSFSSNTKEEIKKKKVLITVTCDNGYVSEFYDLGYSEAELDEMENAICEDQND